MLSKTVATAASRIGLERQTLVKLAVVIAILAVDTVWILASDFTFDVKSALRVTAICALLLLAAWFYRARRPMRQFEVMCTETALLLAFSAAAAMLSYLITSLALPLVDMELIALDRALGFDWFVYVGFVNRHPWLGVLSSAAYMTTISQVALMLILLGVSNRVETAQRFMSAVMVGGLICIAFSAILPAAGALAALQPPAEVVMANHPVVDLSYVQVIFDLRDGTLRALSLDNVYGLIAFPSYHCTLAALVVLAAYRLGPAIFWPVLALNVAVILSTPIDGGHHLVDGPAGVAVAVLSWRLVAPRSQALVRLAGDAGQAAPAS